MCLQGHETDKVLLCLVGFACRGMEGSRRIPCRRHLDYWRGLLYRQPVGQPLILSYLL